MSFNKNKKVLKYVCIALVVIVIVAVAINFTVLNPINPPAPEADYITVVDLVGRSVNVTTNVKRVVAAHADTLRQVALLGDDAINMLVGVPTYVENFADNLEDVLVYSQLRNATQFTRIGLQAELDIETIAALQPDVILLSATFSQLIDSLEEKTQAPVVCVAAWGNPNNNATLSQFYDGMTLVGKILDMETRAEEINDYYQGELDFVADRLSSISDDDKLTVYLANWANKAGTGWTTSKYWPVEAAGGRNVAGDVTANFIEVSEEQIIEWNPDYVFIHGFKGVAAAEAIIDDPLLQLIPTVNDGEVYGLLGPYIGSDPKSWLIDVYIVATTLYPDQFSDIDIVGKSNETFEFFYGDVGAQVFADMIANRNFYISPEITP